MRRRALALAFATLLIGGTLAGGARADEPPQSLEVDLGDAIPIKFALVPAGHFQQGSPGDETGRNADEIQREVTLSKPIYMSTYPITVGKFAQFVKATGYRTEAEVGRSGGFGWDGTALVQRQEFTWRNPGFPQTDSHPVTIVTFADSEAFAGWLTKKAGRKCGLPTEAEWEFACRAGTTTPYYKTPLADIAWSKANSDNATHPVGEKAANAFGLYDMSGNVFQWCRDWYAPYAAGPLTDPVQTRDNLSDKPRRVLRGGSWLREAKDCRSAARYKNSPGSRNADNGIRLVAAVEAAAKPRAESASAPAEVPDTGVAPVPSSGGSDVTFGPGDVPAPRTDPMQRLAAPPDDDGAANLWLVAALLIFGGAILWVVIKLVQRANAANSQPFGANATGRPFGPQSQPYATGNTVNRIVSDGFWLGLLNVSPGSSVRYRCLLDGQPHTGRTVVQTGTHGHFIYTGATPANVEILGVDPPTGNAPLDNLTPFTAPQFPTHSPPPTTSRSFSGYPSAY